jgi:hypothetical protein
MIYVIKVSFLIIMYVLTTRDALLRFRGQRLEIISVLTSAHAVTSDQEIEIDRYSKCTQDGWSVPDITVLVNGVKRRMFIPWIIDE